MYTLPLFSVNMTLSPRSVGLAILMLSCIMLVLLRMSAHSFGSLIDAYPAAVKLGTIAGSGIVMMWTLSEPSVIVPWMFRWVLSSIVNMGISCCVISGLERGRLAGEAGDISSKFCCFLGVWPRGDLGPCCLAGVFWGCLVSGVGDDVCLVTFDFLVFLFRRWYFFLPGGAASCLAYVWLRAFVLYAFVPTVSFPC